MVRADTDIQAALNPVLGMLGVKPKPGPKLPGEPELAVVVGAMLLRSGLKALAKKHR